MAISGIENITEDDIREVIRIVRPEARSSSFDLSFRKVGETEDWVSYRWHPHMVEEFCFFRRRSASNHDRVFDIHHRMASVNFDLVYKAYNYLKAKGYKIPV